MDVWFEIAAKALVYAAALAAIGAGGLRRLLLPRLRGQVEHDVLLHNFVRADRALVVAAAGCVVGLLLRAWAHTVAAFGLADASSWSNFRLIAFESRWGSGWQLQAAASVLLLVTAFWALRGPRFGGALTCICLVILCLAVPQTGHAAEHSLRVFVHAVHVLAGGLWIGTLAVAIVATSADIRLHALRAFAPIAVAGVALMWLSGLTATFLYLGPLSNLWTTDYGRRLLLKVATVAVALAIGSMNWRALHRGSGHGDDRLPTLEASVGFIIVLLTAWLTETAHP